MKILHIISPQLLWITSKLTCVVHPDLLIECRTFFPKYVPFIPSSLNPDSVISAPAASAASPGTVLKAVKKLEPLKRLSQQLPLLHFLVFDFLVLDVSFD
jgi:hypothetical protein